jgi:hypothetical protein
MGDILNDVGVMRGAENASDSATIKFFVDLELELELYHNHISKPAALPLFSLSWYTGAYCSILFENNRSIVLAKSWKNKSTNSALQHRQAKLANGSNHFTVPFIHHTTGAPWQK